jgi:hypothetical protein
MMHPEVIMTDPLVGTWKLNVEESEFDVNHRPQAGTIVYEIDADGYYIKKAEGINKNGEKCVERPERFIPDGKPHPVPDFPGLSYTVTRTDPSTIRGQVTRQDASVVGGSTSSVSPDGRTLTITNFGYDSQLRQFRMRTVWDREG